MVLTQEQLSALQYVVQAHEYCVYQLYLEECMEEDVWDLKQGKGEISYFQLLVRILKEALLLKILERLIGKLPKNLKRSLLKLVV